GTSNASKARPGRINKPGKKQSGTPVPEKHTKKNTKEQKKLESHSNAHSSESGKSNSTQDKKEHTDTKNTATAKKNKKDAGESGKKNDNTARKTKKQTPTQYDNLRQAVKQRLEKARQTGELAPPPGGGHKPGGGGPSSARASNTGPSRVEPVNHHASNNRGNAVYKIDAQGFVHEIFRESVMILSVVKKGKSLIVATGNQGQL